MKTLRRSRLAAVGVTAAGIMLIAACGGQQTGSNTTGEGGGASGQVRADGSSTVAPLSSAAAELFRMENPNVQVTVATSGTGGGFEQFCSGNTDISNASRAIEEDEIARCEENGIEFTELRMATDALSVVVNPENDFVQCLTVEQLQTMWSPESEGQISSWNQVDPAFPDEPLVLFGPGSDSGTFDYFTEAVNGEGGATRTDFSASEDDNVLVQGIAGDPGATGYFGLSYVLENEGVVRAVEIDGGAGCQPPSAETAQADTYIPLSRPLFIYVNNEQFQRPEVAEFVNFYADQVTEIAEAAGFIAPNEEQIAELENAVASLGGG